MNGTTVTFHSLDKENRRITGLTDYINCHQLSSSLDEYRTQKHPKLLILARKLSTFKLQSVELEKI